MLTELLRPPPHRGPLIAAGAVVLAVGLATAELRLSSDTLAPFWHLLMLAVAAGVIFALGLQAPNEGGRPPAYQSVLLVTGLLLRCCGWPTCSAPSSRPAFPPAS